MTARFTQALASFVILVIAYLGYARAVVPLIEPAKPPRNKESGVDERVAMALADYEMPTEQFRPLLEPLFKPDSWERAPNVMIIKSNDLLLLMQDYRPLDDGRLHLNPCTVVQLPTKNEKKQTWMIQASEGAVLKFDKPIDPRSGKIGNLESGYLPGHVVISGSPSLPDGSDRVEIDTQGVQLTRESISTANEVHFRFGSSFGSGRDLTIRMQPQAAGEVRRLPSPAPATFRQIELVHLDQAVFFLPADSSRLAAERLGQAPSPGQPIRVTCAGPVVMDLEGGFASINREVRVEREREGQASERVQCDQLAAYFGKLSETPVGQIEAAGSPPHGSRLQAVFPKLELQRVVAVGQPAILTTTSENSDGQRRWHQVTAGHLECDLADTQGVASLGNMRAKGAGNYQTGLAGNDSTDTTTEMQLGWRDEIQIRQLSPVNSPAGSGPAVELIIAGDALCDLRDIGRIHAQRMNVRFRNGGTPSSTQLRLDHIVAEEYVSIETDEVVAKTNRLDVDVQDIAPTHPAVASGTPAGGGLMLHSPKGASSTNDDATLPNGQNVPVRKFQIGGQTLQVNLVRMGNEHQLQDIVLNGQVRCVEVIDDRATADIEMTGERFQLKHFSSSGGQAVIQGSPAIIRARQMSLTGNSIHLDRDQNEMWIDGRGSAVLPLPGKMAVQYPNSPPTANVHWTGGLRFDGQMIQCKDQVMVRGPAQRITTDELTAILARPVDFGSWQLDSSQIELASLVADGNVDLESRSLDRTGLISIDKAHVMRLQIDQDSQKISGEGPGWIESVRREKNSLAASISQPRNAPANERPDIGTSDPSDDTAAPGLVFLRVDFQQGFDGGMAQKRITFRNGVQAVYGPVKNWNERVVTGRQEGVKPQTVMLKCQQLDVYQMPGQATNQFELMATGNTIVEGKSLDGQLFAAQAHRLSYHQSKDLMMLQGDGRSDAQLWYQQRVGAKWSRLPAQQIRYWPHSNRYKLDGAAMLELNLGD